MQDLGSAWHDLTGLPFVYAVWAGRPDAVDGDGIARLQASLEQGLAARPTIARAWGEAHGGDPAFYESYLTRNIRYRLGAEELSGMAAFFERARAAGLLPRPVRPRLYEARVSTAAPRPPRARRARSTRCCPTPLPACACRPRTRCASTPRRPVLELGAAADQRRRALHPEDVVTYIIDRNVNYTNVCVTRCKFCNFYRPPTHKTEGYVLTREELARKFQETVDLGGVQILLQGGLNPNLPIAWYEDLFRWMKANFPLAIHGLSPEEIRYIAEIENMPIRAVIERLMAAGLDSIPGGGAEILDDEIRYAISPLKCTTDTWLEVMRQGHALGLRTTATMVFGFGEEPRHIVGHLERLRALAGPDRRLHGLHLLAVPGRGDAPQAARRHDGHALPAHLRAVAPVPGQLPQPAGVVADDGPRGRSGRPALWRQRLRLGDDRRERRVAGGRRLQAVRRGHRALHPDGRVHAAPAQHAVRTAGGRLRHACGWSARAG